MAAVLKALFVAALISVHGYVAEIVEKSLPNSERDVLAVQAVSNLGLTLKCLTDVAGDANTISAIYAALTDSIKRAQQIPADALLQKDYMDVVYEQTSLSVAAVASINPECANITSYCQHRNDVKEFATPQEIKDLEKYLLLTAPMAICLMRQEGEGIREQIYNIFENAVAGIRNDISVDTTPVQMVLLQAKHIGTELLKLDNNCQKYAIKYNYCAHAE